MQWACQSEQVPGFGRIDVGDWLLRPANRDAHAQAVERALELDADGAAGGKAEKPDFNRARIQDFVPEIVKRVQARDAHHRRKDERSDPFRAGAALREPGESVAIRIPIESALWLKN